MQPSILSCQIFWTSASVRISVEVLAFGPFPQFGGEVADREPGPGLPFKSHWKKKWKRLWCYIICMLYYNMYIIYVCVMIIHYMYMCVCVLIYFDKSFMAFYTIKIKLRHLLSIYFKGVISYNSSKWLCKPTSKWVKIFKNHRRYKFSTHLIWRPSISVI